MKKLFLLILGIVSIFVFGPYTKTAAQGIEPDSGAVVCTPSVYSESPGDCLPLGPSTFITEMGKLGMSFPPRPLPAFSPDPGLTQLPYFYFHLEDDIVPILSGPAGSETGQAFQPGFVYVSYVDRVESNGVYYMLQNGGWI